MMIVDLDEAFADILHLPKSALYCRTIYDLTHPDDLGLNRRLLDGLRNEGTPISIKKRYMRPDGSSVWVNNFVSRCNFRDSAATLLADVSAIDAPPEPAEDCLLAMAQHMLRNRRIRPRFFGADLFGEPEFDILLELFVHQRLGRTLSTTGACSLSGVPTTTALRYIFALVERGWIERMPDAADGRRVLLTITAEGLAIMHCYLEECRASSLVGDRAEISYFG